MAYVDEGFIEGSTRQLASEIISGRIAAHEKHGNNSIEALEWDNPKWFTILIEGVGELAHEFTYDATGSVRAEMIDVATVITAWIAAYDLET